MELFEIEKDELYSGSRKKDVSEAQSIYCYICVRELGESMTDYYTEVVTRELSQGRNTLVLSSEANLTDRIAEDKDRLVFIVP